MNKLIELYEKYEGKSSDKWSLYLSEYEKLLSPVKENIINLLEIGVQNGGSLEIWGEYFSNAQNIIGCDIDSNCSRLVYSDERIKVVIGDASLESTKAEISKIVNNFNLIIDDGSHNSSDIIRSFLLYFPLLENEGIYIIEDLHCSYWQEYGGGIYAPHSSMAFFKALSDIINFEHWGVFKAQDEPLQSFYENYKCADFAYNFDFSSIHSIIFMNSLCIIKKDIENNNKLSSRYIAGNNKLVSNPTLIPLKIEAPSQQHNIWSNSINRFDNVWVQKESLKDIHKAQNKRINDLIAEKRLLIKQRRVHEKTIEDLNDIKNTILVSNSWRLTKPLRLIGDVIKRIRSSFKVLTTYIKSTGLKKTYKKTVDTYKRIGLRGLIERIKWLFDQQTTSNSYFITVQESDDYLLWNKKYNYYDEETLNQLVIKSHGFKVQPLISIIMPVYNANPEWLKEAIESVQSQTYERWQLCIADDCSTDIRIKEILLKKQQEDSRINVIFREKNGHISAASNSALSLAKGEWIALLDHDDVLPVYALHYVVGSINEHPEGRLFYSDEDKINENRQLCDPYFKSDWNRTLFYSQNMISHLGVYKKSIVDKVQGFREGYEGSQDYDLALRFIEQISDQQIIHIPKVLYHWRIHAGSVACATNDAKPYAVISGQKALNEHFLRIGLEAYAEINEFNNYRIIYKNYKKEPLVSIVIPTRNAHELVKQCIESIELKTNYFNYEIILIDNGSDNPEALEYFDYLSSKENIKVIRDGSPFNYSYLNNKAVKEARGELICLLNNDIEIISENWLQELVCRAILPNVGAVGAKLYYPNDTVQHAGVVIGMGGVAGHIFKNFPKSSNGYFGWLNLDREYLAVTGACLMLKKSLFEEVGGFNAESLAIAFNDVDLCLKLYAKGYRNIYTPYAELYHHESVSRGTEDTPEKIARFSNEVKYMQETWADYIERDPAYNPNLTLTREDCSLRWEE